MVENLPVLIEPRLLARTGVGALMTWPPPSFDSLQDTASFADVQPGARVGDKAKILSLVLDFVF